MDTDQEVARRCIEDPAYAEQILAGSDYPAVRDALYADMTEGVEVTGFLNPQPLPPSNLHPGDPIRPSDSFSSFKLGGGFSQQWSSLSFNNLKAIALQA